MLRPALAAAGMSALLIACAPADDNASPAEEPAALPVSVGGSAAGTRPAEQPNFFTVEGRISEGVECPILTTPDGKVYSLGTTGLDFSAGDYVEITAELADASFCMQGDGTLIVDSISPATLD